MDTAPFSPPIARCTETVTLQPKQNCAVLYVTSMKLKERAKRNDELEPVRTQRVRANDSAA